MKLACLANEQTQGVTIEFVASSWSIEVDMVRRRRIRVKHGVWGQQSNAICNCLREIPTQGYLQVRYRSERVLLDDRCVFGSRGSHHLGLPLALPSPRGLVIEVCDSHFESRCSRMQLCLASTIDLTCQGIRCEVDSLEPASRLRIMNPSRIITERVKTFTVYRGFYDAIEENIGLGKDQITKKSLRYGQMRCGKGVQIK